MAVGKPIIGAIDGETEKVIADAECGYSGKAEDAEKLAENIRKFIGNLDRDLMGKMQEHIMKRILNKKIYGWVGKVFPLRGE